LKKISFPLEEANIPQFCMPDLEEENPSKMLYWKEVVFSLAKKKPDQNHE